MHGTHTRSQNHSFSGLLTGIRGAEEKNQEWKGFPCPCGRPGNQMEIKDGKTGSPEAKPHGSPGRKKEIREIKKPFREPAWGQPEEPGGGTKDSGIKKGFPERKLDGNPQHVKRRRATLPHPLECSTIAAPGLSYRVRNGTGRLTRAMTTAKPRSRNDSQNKWQPFRPLCYEPWRLGNRLADARQTPIVVSSHDHPNAYCRPGRSSTGKTRNQSPARRSECCVAVAR